MLLDQIESLHQNPNPLKLVDLPRPEPGHREILVRVSTCGVCHTELDEIEGRTPPPRLPVVPGHQVVGYVQQLGQGATRYVIGDRVGVGWIHSSTGNPNENVAPEFRATGRDENGGYAEFMTVPESYAYPIPAVFSDDQAAPLLCAGAIGFRALSLTGLSDGQPLGLTGFGASAHLVLQLARHLFPHSPVYVFARHPAERAFALRLGASWAGDTSERSPIQLRSIIDTTPAWKPVVEALANLAPGGRLVINAIRKEDSDKDQLLRLSYTDHLWLEREIKTVANITGEDLKQFLPLAAQIPLRPEITTYPLAEANRALYDLKQGGGSGAKVLVIRASNAGATEMH
jgi:propanol-preferring alcohol dehydrogenase